MNIQKKLFLIPLAFIFLAVLVQAASVTTSLFYDSTTSNSTKIVNGQSIGVIISADSVLEASMRITLNLINSSGSLVNNLLNTYTTKDSYSNYLILGSAAYLVPGNYTIVSTVTGASGQSSSNFLKLEVLPQALGNNPPIITSTPPSQVNKSTLFTYQVTATDADNDPLTYTLTQNPTWISMNSSGFMSGLAPNVPSDTNYVITLQVSDGKTFVTQTFTLTVKNVTVGTNPDTTPPVVTIVSPQNNQVFNVSTVPLSITTNKNSSSASYTLSNGTTSINFSMAQTSSISFSGSIFLPDGNYSVIFYATDLAGNLGKSSAINFSVNTTVPGNPNPPIITVVSPKNNQFFNTSTASFSITTNKNISNAWLVLDGLNNFSLSKVTSTNFAQSFVFANGNHTAVFYATDLAGNVGVSSVINFTIDTIAPVVNIISPQNGTNYTSNVTSINFTAIDANLATCWYSIDGGLTIILTQCNAPITNITSIQGTNTWIVYAVDAAGNQASQSVTFNVNTSSGGSSGGAVGGVSRKTSGTNAVTDLSFENQQYSNQFLPGKGIQTESNTTGNTAVSGSALKTFLIILLLACLLLFGILAFFLISREE